MKVSELMTTDVATCHADQSCADAARSMWDRDVGCVPVCDGPGGGQVLGVVTDRDIAMAAYHQGRPIRDIRIHEIMARDLVTCRPDDDVQDVEERMSSTQVRRLPVVDDAGTLRGMISLADVARSAVRSRGSRKRDRVKEGEVAEVLASIVQPREVQQNLNAR